MAKKRIINQLPEILRTNVQSKFFDATVDQLFSSSDDVSVDGFIGRRDSGFYDPLKDYYLPQPTRERMWNLLEPMVLAKAPGTDDVINKTFVNDLINYISHKGGNVKNQDRLFSSEFYSFSPPIDMDKFVNYSAYTWKPDIFSNMALPIDTTNAANSTFQSRVITNTRDYLGRKNYTYVAPNGTQVVFTNGLLIAIPGQQYFVGNGLPNQNIVYQVCGVGSANGISVVARYPNYKSATYISGKPQDYTTIEFGGSNVWSQNNFWFHKDVIRQMAILAPSLGLGNNVQYVDNNLQAKRPIISFDNTLELYLDTANAYPPSVYPGANIPPDRKSVV